MHLLVPKNIQTIYFSYEVHLLDYCLPQYLLSSDSKAMELDIVSSLLRSFKTFNKKKQNQSFTILC